MCIRDSLYAAHAKLEEITLDKETSHYKNQVALKFGELVYNGQWYTPVSYTHLDVYKRQVLYWQETSSTGPL